MSWQDLQNRVIQIIDGLSFDEVPFKAYALAYAENILANIDEGYSLGIDTKSACKTQLLYVISNLDGAKQAMIEIENIAKEYEVDISEGVGEALNA